MVQKFPPWIKLGRCNFSIFSFVQERNSQATPSKFPLPLGGQTSTEAVATGVEEEAVVVEEVRGMRHS